MKRLSTIALCFTAMISLAAAAGSPPQLPDFARTPQELSAMAPTGGAGGSGNAGVQVIALFGDPSKAGPYSQLLKVAPHATIAAHHHAGDRIATVLSGTWRFGYGESFDEKHLHVLPAGSVYTEPSDRAHFAMTRDEPVTVLISGYGPTTTVYERVADDPATRH